MSATVVLVHGAWHGAWCFERVMPLLRDAGVPAIAMDLPGHGDHGGSFSDLHGDAAHVRAGTNRVVWPAGHSPFLSHPTLVSALLAELATAIPTR